MRTAIATAVLGLALGAAAGAEEDPGVAPLFSAEHPAGAMLAAFREKGKSVALVLTGGTRYVGKVKTVGANAVILTELQGKEYFDAWIRLDSIAAMEERVRLR